MEKYKILIIEDEKNILNDLKEVFEDEDYAVDTADNGQSALEMWERNIYDLTLVDLRIPKIDGRDLINRFKEERPYIQIVILSGQGKEGDLIDAINKHVFAFLPKPDTDLDKVLETTKNALQNRDPVLISLETMAEKSPNEPTLLIGRDAYSPRKLYDELRKGTKIGRQFRDQFIKTLTDFEPPKESLDELLKKEGVLK